MQGDTSCGLAVKLVANPLFDLLGRLVAGIDELADEHLPREIHEPAFAARNLAATILQGEVSRDGGDIENVASCVREWHGTFCSSCP